MGRGTKKFKAAHQIGGEVCVERGTDLGGNGTQMEPVALEEVSFCWFSFLNDSYLSNRAAACSIYFKTRRSIH